RALQLAWRQRSDGVDAGHVAPDFRLVDLRLRSVVLSLGGFDLRRRRLDLLLFAHALQCLHVLQRGVVVGLRLRELYLRLIDGLARRRPFLDELLWRFEQFRREVGSIIIRLDTGRRLAYTD